MSAERGDERLARRVWSAVYGEGTMRDAAAPEDARVEFDNGFVLRMDWRKWSMGTPASRELEETFYAKKGGSAELFDRDSEHAKWDTYTLRTGDVVVLRRGGRPPAGTPEPGKAPRKRAAPASPSKQLTLGGEVES